MKALLNSFLRMLKQQYYFCWLITGLFIYAVACYAKTQSIDAPTWHVDGAFQNASGLFRLLAGELPGRDFYPYIGIGPIGLGYPIFLIMGANLCASVFTSHFLVHIAAALSIAIIVHLLWKPTSLLTSIVIAGGLCSLPQLLLLDSSYFRGMYAVPDWVGPFLSPGPSLRPLRAFIPYLAIYAVYFFILPEKNMLRKYIYYGLTTGVVSLWSNDYALLTLMAISVVVFGNFVKDSNLTFFKTVLIFILVSVVSVVLIQWSVTGGHPLKLARYNFVDVANDQWWYFGPWWEPLRIFSPNEIIKISFDIVPLFFYYVLGGTFFSAMLFKQLRLELFLIFVIGALLLAGGVLASVGGHIIADYFEGFKSWAWIVCLLGSGRLVCSLIPERWIDSYKSIFHFFIVAACLFVVAIYAMYANKSLTALHKMRAAADVFYVPELGGYLDKSWVKYIDYIREHSEKPVVEEYFGLWGAMLKKPGIWSVDSSIHALGNVREMAKNSLPEKADIVITSNRRIVNQFGWNVSANYWFYKPLFENYKPVFYAPTLVVWEKSQPIVEGKLVPCSISDTKESISLDVPRSGYYEVQLTTATKKIKPSRYLKMFSSNMNFYDWPNNQVSIPLKDGKSLLPVYASTQGKNNFEVVVRPKGVAEVIIEACSAKEIRVKNSEILIMSEGDKKIYEKGFNSGNVYEDKNFWDRGISTATAGFYIYKDKNIINNFKIGSVVQLANGEMRIVTSLGATVAYLEVYLTGDKLIPEKSGLPYEFKLITGDKLEKWAISVGDSFFTMMDKNWKNGISLQGAGFVVPNTEKNRKLFVHGNSVKIPNTTDRVIKNTISSGVYLWVWLDGDLLDSSKVGFPSKFKVIEAQMASAPVSHIDVVDVDRPTTKVVAKATTAIIKDDFFVTDLNWKNGVAIHWAGFFIQNTAANKALYTVGKKVDIPNTNVREIVEVNEAGIYLNIHVTGDPMEGSEVGLPNSFIVLPEDNK